MVWVPNFSAGLLISLAWYFCQGTPSTSPLPVPSYFAAAMELIASAHAKFISEESKIGADVDKKAGIDVDPDQEPEQAPSATPVATPAAVDGVDNHCPEEIHRGLRQAREAAARRTAHAEEFAKYLRGVG